MLISLPRTFRISGSGSRTKSRPRSAIRPSSIFPVPESSRMMEKLVTLFPLPDSPTMPSVCPS